MGLCTSRSSLAIANYLHPQLQKKKERKRKEGKIILCAFVSFQHGVAKLSVHLKGDMCTLGLICRDNLVSQLIPLKSVNTMAFFLLAPPGK